MLTRGGQGRSLEWFGQGRFTFLAPHNGGIVTMSQFHCAALINLKYLNSITKCAIRVTPTRRVNAPNEATLLPCKTRYSVIAGRLLQVTRWAAGRAKQPVRFSAFYLWWPTR